MTMYNEEVQTRDQAKQLHGMLQKRSTYYSSIHCQCWLVVAILQTSWDLPAFAARRTAYVSSNETEVEPFMKLEQELEKHLTLDQVYL